MKTLTPLFDLGQVVATPGALQALQEAAQTPLGLITRHVSGDWGEICPEDAAQNALSLVHGYRLMSVYSLANGTKLWIITEADRSSTCLLLPEEY
jgi:hypothetical protein